MNIKKLSVLYFSPTGGTEKIARHVAGELGKRLGLEPEYIPFTKPAEREGERRFGPGELLVMASPVYAGRLPNKLMPEYQAKILGDGPIALPICVFGNRSPDEALRELALLLEGNGFQLAGGAAFAGRHAFSDQVGEGRPDGDDLAHTGFEAFRSLMDRYRPKYFIHGHVHLSYNPALPRLDTYGETQVINGFGTYYFDY